jgi:parallel beta-helix repeat protein
MRNSVPRISAALAICSWFLIAARPVTAQSTTIYVDPGIGAASCNAYDPTRRICLGGTSTAYLTIAGAASVAKPGWTVLIRAGTYRERLSPVGSGTQSQPLVFRRYSNEIATITGISPGILLMKKEYIEIDGVTVTDVLGWARLEDSRNITIRNSVFRRATATGTTGGMKLVRSSDNRIVNNIFDDGNDNMILVDSADRNLIQDNIFQEARHSLLSVRCSNFNVFRGNSFSNTKQKAIEIYDCEGTSTDTPFRLDATKHNLFELNSVTKTLASDLEYRYNGIQHGAQQTIVRRNLFRNNDGGTVGFAVIREVGRLAEQAYSAFGEEARRREIDYSLRGEEAAPTIVSDGDRVGGQANHPIRIKPAVAIGNSLPLLELGSRPIRGEDHLCHRSIRWPTPSRRS